MINDLKRSLDTWFAGYSDELREEVFICGWIGEIIPDYATNRDYLAGRDARVKYNLTNGG